MTIWDELKLSMKRAENMSLKELDKIINLGIELAVAQKEISILKIQLKAAKEKIKELEKEELLLREVIVNTSPIKKD